MLSIFRNTKKETKTQIEKRVLSLCEDGSYGLCPPTMDAQVALSELAKHLLGENWYSTMPISQEQINTQIVYEIEAKYPRVKDYWRHK